VLHVSVPRQSIGQSLSSFGTISARTSCGKLLGQLCGTAFVRLQVRGLSGTAYKADQEKFVEMAQASLALGRAYINLASGGANKAAGSSSAQTSASTPPGPSETSARSSQEQGGAQISSPTLAFSPTAGRELAAARMHLRGVIKQCESAFEEHELYKQLQALLDQVVALESEAQAAAGRT
jgi:hypothetical protein